MSKLLAALLGVFFTVNGWQGDLYFNNEGLYFPVTLTNQQQSVYPDALLDTGANDLLVPLFIAKELKLPDMGSTSLYGISDSPIQGAFDSEVTITIAGNTFTNVPCIVTPNSNIVFFDMGTIRNLGFTSLSINVKNNSVTFGRNK